MVPFVFSMSNTDWKRTKCCVLSWLKVSFLCFVATSSGSDPRVDRLCFRQGAESTQPSGDYALYLRLARSIGFPQELGEQAAKLSVVWCFSSLINAVF